MEYYYSKSDLETFSKQDLDILTNYYDISTDNKTDLLWLLSIAILNNTKYAEMPPDKAWTRYGDSLLKKFAIDRSAPKDAKKLPAEMVTADPTPNKKYLLWIITSYLDDGIKLFEDMGRTKIALKEYAYLLRKKLIKNKFEQNIGAFCGLAGCVQGRKKTEKEGLDAYLDRYDDSLAEMRKVEEIRITEKEVKKIHEDEDLLIISPLTREASCKYGAGTKWCTAAREGSMFEQYSKLGPLYILIPKKPKYNREKYQIHIESHQYMNEQDEEIDYEDLRKRFPSIKNVPEFAQLEILAGIIGGNFDPKLLENVTKVDFADQYIDDKEIEPFAKALGRNSTIVTLNLRGNKVTGAGYLAKAIEKNSTLTMLNVSSNSIADTGAEYLAKAIEKNSTLTMLNVSSNSIAGTGAEYLAKAIEKNSTLTTLDVSHNTITDIGAEYFAQAFEKNSTLITLNLGWNMILDRGAEYLAQALEKNSTLATLDITHNLLTNIGAKYLAGMLEKNSTLTTLDISRNRIKDTGAEYFAQALEKNSTLTTLNLSFNEIAHTGVEYLAKALEKNSTLTTLNLGYNYHIKDKGAQYLIKALEKNSTLTVLDLEEILISDKLEQQIKDILAVRKS